MDVGTKGTTNEGEGEGEGVFVSSSGEEREEGEGRRGRSLASHPSVSGGEPTGPASACASTAAGVPRRSSACPLAVRVEANPSKGEGLGCPCR